MPLTRLRSWARPRTPAHPRRILGTQPRHTRHPNLLRQLTRIKLPGHLQNLHKHDR
jgi:hypothetical protein